MGLTALSNGNGAEEGGAKVLAATAAVANGGWKRPRSVTPDMDFLTLLLVSLICIRRHPWLGFADVPAGRSVQCVIPSLSLLLSSVSLLHLDYYS